MVLVDTSVWIEHLRTTSSFEIEQAVELEDVVTCAPVIQELLQGIRDERHHRQVAEALRALPIVESPMRLEVYEEAAGLYRSARRLGLTVRSGVDCLIATCAIRNELSVLHRDRDYELISRASVLESRSI